jgi:hypothetical protein
MRSVVGVSILAGGALCALVSCIWGLSFALPVARELGGSWATIATVAFFPVTLILTPWYFVIVKGAWTPTVVIYGGAVMALVLIGGGSAVVVSHLGTNSGFGKPRRRLAFWRHS